MFKKYKQDIKPGSIVMVVDKINRSTQQPMIGVVTECLSERTCKLVYVSREAKIDPLSYKIEQDPMVLRCGRCLNLSECVWICLDPSESV